MAKKYLLISILALGTITPLHHDNLDGFVANEHIDWTNASDNLKTSGTFHLTTAKTPSGASDTGTAGQVCWDSSYVYVCIATDTWKRATLSAFAIAEYLLLETGDTLLLETGDKLKLESST